MPWAEMLRWSMAVGISPGQFWHLSLKEWRMLTQDPHGSKPMGRDDLKAMMALWPDGETMR
jgi:Conserved hypothetical phage protein (DUF2376).